MEEVRAQSGIVSTVLIILISIIAMIIVYNVVLGLVKTTSGRINTKAFRTQLDIRDVDLWVTGGASITIKRSSLLGKLDSLKVVLYDNNGASHVALINETARLPKILETRRIMLGRSEIPINNSQRA